MERHLLPYVRRGRVRFDLCGSCVVPAFPFPDCVVELIRTFVCGEDEHQHGREYYRQHADLAHSDHILQTRTINAWCCWRRNHKYLGLREDQHVMFPKRLARCDTAIVNHMRTCSLEEFERCQTIFKNAHKHYRERAKRKLLHVVTEPLYVVK